MIYGIEKYRKDYEQLLPKINQNIEKYRKGNFTLQLRKKDGSPCVGTVTVEQRSHAFDFGTNVLMLGAMGEKEQAYRDAITNLFNLVTTTFCWPSTELSEGVFRFEEGVEEIYRRPPAERVLRFAQENRLKAKGQPLLADSWFPDWASRDPDTLKKQYANYFKKVAERYDGKYTMFDVVNESLLCKRRTPDYPLLGDDAFDYMKWALETAGDIFSKDCILERNESTPVNYGEQAQIYYEQNARLLADGVRLDAIGYQFHFFSGQSCVREHILGEVNFENIYEAYEKMSTLGVPLYITEVTIPSFFEELTPQQGEDLQAEILENLYRLWFSVGQMKGIIYWNLKDGDTWQGEDLCRGRLLDEFLRKKKSYYTIEHLIKREWNTSFVGQTDASGRLEFNGFYGDYDIVAVREGRVLKSKSISLDVDRKVIAVTLDAE